MSEWIGSMEEKTRCPYMYEETLAASVIYISLQSSFSSVSITFNSLPSLTPPRQHISSSLKISKVNEMTTVSLLLTVVTIV